MWDFFVRVVCERECEDSRQSEEQEVFMGSSWEAFPWSEACALHMTRMWRVIIDGDNWFSQDTRETFCFANLSYLIHQVSTHTIYTHIIHILRGVLFREKTLATTFESERLLYPKFSTPSTMVFLNSYLSISKSLKGW